MTIVKIANLCIIKIQFQYILLITISYISCS
nr:MAG TPA: hypothetical protein [Caudoviricetes sp.]